MFHLRIQGYVLGRALYESSVTVVVRATREADRVPVILKLPCAERPSLREIARYRHEHELLESLAEGVVVKPIGVVQVEHRPVLVMEDLSCVTLAEYFAGAAPELRELLRVALGMTRALARLHASGTIHKDINPSNVVITPVGAVRLIDLGIATRLSHEPQALAHPGMLEGTLSHMSPEQTGRMNCAVDARSDLYSLGVTLFGLFTGKLPFESEDPMGYVHAHIARQAPALSELVPDVPRVLERMVARLLAKSADDRYQTAAGVAHDLQRALEVLDQTGQLTELELGTGDVRPRFEIPHGLYGRQRELETLLNVFERVAGGHCELLLVGGYSGIGKSALVNELQKPIVARRGYFAAGKFDQYNRNVPYSALSSAFRELVHYLLMEPTERVERWRRAILAAVGQYGRVLLDVIPALELLIGPQPTLPVVAQSEVKSRFDDAFRALLAVLARIEHPLVLFLDDVQWADIPSLHLLETLLTQSERQPFLVIAAYRDNEVDATHPVPLLAEALRRAGQRVSKITLGPLALEDTQTLVADALHLERHAVAQLAALLQSRTSGNPFFLLQLLQALEDEGLLTLDASAGCFSWDFATIRDQGLTGDVIELMAMRLRHLPAPTRELLKLASCVGAEFDLHVLTQLVEQPFELSETQLWPALAAELIVPADSADRHASERRARYRFLHDRVQQAAYALLDDHERELARAKLGWLLVAVTPEERLDSAIFDIVAHLNLGLEHVSEPELREQIARLNIRAARRAKAASAHKAAATHYAIAIQLLGPTLWASDYAQAYELHLERAECEYVSGQHETAESLALTALQHARSELDAARLYSLRIRLCITGSQFAVAVRLGIEALRLFGYQVELDPERLAVAARAQSAQLELALRDVDIPSLLSLPEMQDAVKRALMEILNDIWCAACMGGDTQINAYLVDLQVCLSVEFGHTPQAAFAYMLHGMQARAAGQVRRAYELGALALGLNERFPDPVVTVQAGNMFANCINPFVNHLETNLPHYRRSYEIGSRVGELIYTIWAVNFMLVLKLNKGDPLAEAYDESLAYLGFIQKANDQSMLTTYTLELQMLRALRGLTAGRNRLDEGDFVEAEALARHSASHFAPGDLFYGAYRSGVHLVFRDYRAALATSQIAEAALAADPGSWVATNVPYHQALALCGLYLETEASQRAALLDKVREHLAKLTDWAETGPANYAHRRDLVAAELARCTGDHVTAARLYDRALEQATLARYLNDVALTAEAASYFHRASGSTLAARAYLTESHYAYMRWGADAKVAELRAQYPELQIAAPTRSSLHATWAAPSSVNRLRSSHSEHDGASLDSHTVIKAAQALSGEIGREALCNKLLQLSMENAGARGVWLVLNEPDGLQIVARAAIDRRVSDLPAPLPVGGSHEFPTAIVQYVARTQAPVVLRNASREGRFRDDPDVRARGARSIACVPLSRQGRLAGVLYLENGLVEGAFTNEHVEILQLIAAQASISLENAALYANLEARVRERTRALDMQNARMRTLLDNVGQGFLLANQRGELEPQYSRVLESWFGVPAVGVHAWDYLFGHDRRTADIAQLLWQMLSDEMYALELSIAQMPERIVRAGRTFDFAYRPLLDGGGALEHVVIVVTDVTQTLSAERVEAGRQELADVLDRALADRAGFREFLEEGHNLVAELHGEALHARRAIHTLKANCELWQLKSVSSLCHALEARYADNDTVSVAQLQAIQAAWQELVVKVERLLSRDGDELGVRVADYTALRQAVTAERPYRELERMLDSWTKELVTARLTRLAAAVIPLAGRLGKPRPYVAIESAELLRAGAQLAPLWAALVHLLRNAIDHGLEAPSEREARGKSAEGRLIFRARSQGEQVLIELEDDGRGIDWTAVAAQGRRAGLPTTSAADLQRVLFADGVSTREQADETSGRGVGLAAVQEAVLVLGGSLHVRSERGLGSCFVLQLPAALFTSAESEPRRVSGAA